MGETFQNKTVSALINIIKEIAQTKQPFKFLCKKKEKVKRAKLQVNFWKESIQF